MKQGTEIGYLNAAVKRWLLPELNA